MTVQESNKESTLKKEESNVQIVKPEPLKTLLSWIAPERPYKKRSREYFTTLGAIVFLIGVILFFLKEWFLIAVIISLMFVNYIMSTIEPQKVEHKITNRGIITGGRKYKWEELTRFWFSQKLGKKILLVETIFPYPGRLMMLLGETKEDELKNILSEYLLFEEPEKTWIEKASDWLSRKVPLETAN